MHKITTLILFFTLVCFSQEKSETAFNFAIHNGYSNSPNLIPITIVDKTTKKEKYYLSDSESLFWANELEYGIKDKDSLESLIRKKSSNQKFEFSNNNALNAIGFYNAKTIYVSKLDKIEKLIQNKEIIKGLENLNRQIQNNQALLEDFSKVRYKIKDSIIQANSSLSKEQIKFLEYLTSETYSPDMSNFGNISNFEGADFVLELWKKSTSNQWQNITKNLKIKDELFKKYVDKYLKKFGRDYLVALFKNGIVFFVSDLNGQLNFAGIVI